MDEKADILTNQNGLSVFPPRKSSYSCIHMNGKEVFRFAVRCVPQSMEAALEEAGITASSIDWLLLHQVYTIIRFNYFIALLNINSDLTINLGKSTDNRLGFKPPKHPNRESHIEFEKLWQHQCCFYSSCSR